MPDNVVALPQRGKTYLTGPNRTADSTYTTSVAIEGIKKVFKDLDYSGTNQAKAPRTGGEVHCILVRNVSGRTLLPKMTVCWKAGYIGTRINNFSAVESGVVAGVVDEWLPSTGVANNDLFWLAVKGPSLCLKESSTTAINYDDWVAAITAAASTTSTTAGRIRAVAATTESTTTLSHALNRIGRAMSTSNTSGASTDFLVYLDLPF
jgi:hypothetical protein